MTRVAVVGGGVTGLASAYELAADHEVVLLEKGQVAGEATSLAAGIIGLKTVYPDVPEVGAYAASFFEAFDGTREFTYTRLGRVAPVPAEYEAEERAQVRRLSEAGVEARWVDTAEAATRWPRIDWSRFVGATEYPAVPGKGMVDPYTLAVTFRAEAEARGADVRTETPVTGIRVDDDAVTGVETADGVVEADHVVVAAGWRTPDLVSELTPLPVRPYRTQIVVLEPDPPLDEDFQMGFVPGEHVYYRPELNGDLLVGGWSFPTDDPEGASSKEDEGFLEHVAELVPRVFRDMDRAEYVNGWAGVDAATPDQRPIVDAPGDAPDGLVVATGFHGRGIMTSPVAAAAVRSLVTGEDAPFPRSTFAVDRFASRTRDFEFASISDH